MGTFTFTSRDGQTARKVNEENFTEDELCALRMMFLACRQAVYERYWRYNDRKCSIRYVSNDGRTKSTVCWSGTGYYLLKHGTGGFQPGTNTRILLTEWIHSLLQVKEAPTLVAVPVTAPPPAEHEEDTSSVVVEEVAAPSPAVHEREDMPAVVVEEVVAPDESGPPDEFDGDTAKQQFNEMVAWLRGENNIPYRSASVIQLAGWLTEIFASPAAAMWLKKNPVWRLSSRAVVQEYGWLCERAEAKEAVAKFLKEW